jgi:hypothetical protein
MRPARRSAAAIRAELGTSRAPLMHIRALLRQMRLGDTDLGMLAV